MVAVIHTLCPTLDLVTVFLFVPHRHTLYFFVSVEVEQFEHLVVAPQTAQEIGHATTRGIDMTETLTQYFHRFLRYVLALAQLAFDKVFGNILGVP